MPVLSGRAATPARVGGRTERRLRTAAAGARRLRTAAAGQSGGRTGQRRAAGPRRWARRRPGRATAGQGSGVSSSSSTSPLAAGPEEILQLATSPQTGRQAPRSSSSPPSYSSSRASSTSPLLQALGEVPLSFMVPSSAYVLFRWLTTSRAGERR